VGLAPPSTLRLASASLGLASLAPPSSSLALLVIGLIIQRIVVGEHRGRPAIGPDLFRKASESGLAGLVSKHRDRPYQSGRSQALDQGKEPEDAFARVQEAHSR